MPSAPEMIYCFLINDFVTAWDAVAHEHHAVARGNFMFGRHVMAMLEWAARLCWSDATDAALRDWSAALHAIEPKYFTALPDPCADTRDFHLPGLAVRVPQEQLLWGLFDLVRTQAWASASADRSRPSRRRCVHHRTHGG